MGAKERFRVSEIRRVSATEISGILYGEVANKSNNRRIFNGISIKSEKALDFVDKVKICGRDIRAKGGLRGATSRKDIQAGLRPLVLSAVIYGASWRRDLDAELLPDALQAAGVIGNDRAIREKHYWWRDDPSNPRIEFSIRVQEREA